MTAPFLINHLWQSSCFVLLAALSALALRKSPPKVRYWVWLSASLKFLVPFALLMSIGSVVPSTAQHAVSVSAPVLPSTLLQITQPFSPAPKSTVPGYEPLDWARATIGALWAVGFLAIILKRWRSWLAVRAALRAGTPIDLPIPIKALITPGTAEPGIVGFLHPVLILPAQLMQHLNVRQLSAILAHEMCHVGRRDNFFAGLHILVEAIFWFHPLVWWIGARMVEEREQACDEEVLRMGCEPSDYVEGILKVCRFYTESPLPCISGVTGADVKKRLRAILEGSIAKELSAAKKMALAAAGLAALTAPVLIGVLNAPAIRAQNAPASTPKFEVASIKRCTVDDTPAAGGGGRGGGGVIGDPGMFRTGCVTVRGLVQRAYVWYANGQVSPPSRLKNQPVQGGPAWIDSDRYSIDAKPGAPQSKAMMGGPMLQALLEERFKLKVHRDSKEVPVYALVVAKGGPKLEATKEGDCTPADATQGPPPIAPGQPLPCGYIGEGKGGDGIEAVGVTMASICQVFSVQLHSAIIDKTGLTGRFNYQLPFNTPPPGAPGDDDQFSVAMGALQKLGLKVESAKGTAEFVVIDHVERPSEN